MCGFIYGRRHFLVKKTLQFSTTISLLVEQWIKLVGTLEDQYTTYAVSIVF